MENLNKFAAQGKRLIKLNEVTAKTGLGRTAIYEKMSDGSFPASVSLGVRAVAWISDEIDTWIDARIAVRDTKLSKATLHTDKSA